MPVPTFTQSMFTATAHLFTSSSKRKADCRLAALHSVDVKSLSRPDYQRWYIRCPAAISCAFPRPSQVSSNDESRRLPLLPIVMTPLVSLPLRLSALFTMYVQFLPQY